MATFSNCFSSMALADMENVPAVPGNVFQGPHNNVYHNFCDKWSPGTELSMTVDTSGNRKNPAELFSRRDVELNLDDYMHYNIDLSFTPSSGMNECVKDCVDAFSQMANDCRSMETQDQLMEQSGAIDVGCGIFNYAITATTPREVQERNCYTADQFGQHDDIYEHNVRFISGFTCAGTALKPIRRGDPSTYISYPAYNGKQPVQMNIYWKDGCILDYPSTDEIYPANPLELDDPGSTFCQDLLINNWEKCDNTGVGGNVQAGCLVYDFKAAHD